MAANLSESFFKYVGELDDNIKEEIRESAEDAAQSFGIDIECSGRDIARQIGEAVDTMLDQDGLDESWVSEAAVRLGCLYGDAICKQYRWTWKEFGPDKESAYYGVVSPEQNWCVIPMPYILRILKGENRDLGGENDNTVLLLFNMLDDVDERPDEKKMVPLQ